MKYKFPQNFYWGTATSSHQIEGNNIHNDWWRAEIQGMVPHKSGKACDSYNRYEEDFDLARSMHNNAHRFSIEWSRIEPREGEFDEKEIEHYRSVIQALRKRGMEPFVTLHHFTNPIWFVDKGGWENKKAPFYFARYAEYVVKSLGDEVKYWITINEANIYINMSALGYGPWTHWPDKSNKNLIKFWRLSQNMANAHKKAYKAIKKIQKDNFVGITIGYTYTERVNNNPFTYLTWLIVNAGKNRFFLNKINRYQDYIGLSYYTRVVVRAHISNPEQWIYFNTQNTTLTSFGWEIYPEGIYFVIKEILKYKKPIYIFENGIADEDDNQRPKFIQEHLKWLHKAIQEGADVRGYFYWSLLDNFEWTEGYKMRFGLVHVDFETFERKSRGSFDMYKEICKNNGF